MCLCIKTRVVALEAQLAIVAGIERRIEGMMGSEEGATSAIAYGGPGKEGTCTLQALLRAEVEVALRLANEIPERAAMHLNVRERDHVELIDLDDLALVDLTTFFHCLLEVWTGLDRLIQDSYMRVRGEGGRGILLRIERHRRKVLGNAIKGLAGEAMQAGWKLLKKVEARAVELGFPELLEDLQEAYYWWQHSLPENEINLARSPSYRSRHAAQDDEVWDQWLRDREEGSKTPPSEGLGSQEKWGEKMERDMLLLARHTIDLKIAANSLRTASLRLQGSIVVAEG
ncbi:hypothetical protein CC1G_10135 [Coprinopsis cinerea okayama7|uniref:Uncharacterized protein n=1 Tax=Coprinopsis cinerea (strain Okayama-7 / 130 / ATCC MYA-4618 / FGSC 9003) TaxID=240176 RepID=A8N3Z6_COPC7|nr:hypothetical protein CC1G_10135 [Coprinopsis cinerea okayama7\|eukprot:XP_001829605.2 hypothetical protein CC1G_10135 [Coprinopsis cinerea okayama7\